jgi:hypothetical protein
MMLASPDITRRASPLLGACLIPVHALPWSMNFPVRTREDADGADAGGLKVDPHSGVPRPKYQPGLIALFRGDAL